MNSQPSKKADRTRTSAEPKGRPFRRKLVLAFVAFHAFAMVVFAVPMSDRPLNAVRDFLSPYTLSIGLNESWDTFAPNPVSSEQFLKAVVVTLRGKTEVYSFPRMEELSFAERYRKERYRKFGESILCKECAGLWPDIERNVARREGTPLDPADKVVLINFDSPINLKTNALGDDAHATPTVLSELSIQSEDLQ